MRKNGHDRNGRQRWQCDTCKATTTATIESRSRASTLRAFLDWLLEAAPQRRLGCDARTFRRRSAWCWGLEPRILPDGVVHHVVMADGTYVNGWCLLTAVDGNDGEVLAWQWCSRESTAAYKALFEQIAPPDVLVCDGMKGIQRACAETWPDTRIQRCLVHVQRDTRADLVYVQCFLSSLGGIFPQLGLLAFRSVGSVWAGGLNEEGIGPPDLYVPEL